MPKALLVLAVVSAAVTAGSLVVVGVALLVGRPAGGDVMIAGLNVAVATVFWIWRIRGR